jgi:hypothetical protein
MRLCRIIIFAALGLLPSGSIVRAADAVLVTDSIVDSQAYNFPSVTFGVRTVHGVTFQQDGAVTYKGWQYAAYYQSFNNGTRNIGRVSVGRRSLPGGTWQTFTFNDYDFTTIDSHNDVVIGICAEDGSIHLSFDHHVNTLRYRKSVAGLADQPTTTAWNASQFGPTLDRFNGSTALTQVTYPRFIPTPSGKLLFTYRSGSSGGGDEVLFEYSGVTGTWTRVGQYTTRSGSYTGTFASGTDRNAYFDMTVFDSSGRLHATWCWRETPDASSNHDLMYAYSDDVGRTWRNQLGAQIAVAGSSFIGVNSPGIIGWVIPQSRNYINNSAMTTDRQGRVHVVAWHLPDAEPNQAFDQAVTSKSRFHHYWRGTDGVWRRNPTTLTGSRAKLAADDDGRLFLMYGDASNLRIATASPSANPEVSPATSWNTWSTLNLVGGALPAGKAVNVNLVTDTSRWDQDRILSLYAQETNVSGTGPTPLHILDYHVSNSAVLPSPANLSVPALPPASLTWTAGIEAVQHDVYFGTNPTAVESANLSSAEYRGRVNSATFAPGALASETSYFWRIDSVDTSGAVSPGRVWSFTTRPLTPLIAVGGASGYGGSATFQGTLDPVIGESASVTLFIGTNDGGTNASAWQQSVDLGSRPLGSLVSPSMPVPSSAMVFRFRATNAYGSAWSTVGTLTADRSLATWARTALITASGYTAGETLSGFPLLVRLDSANVPGFSYSQMLSSAGADLVFTSEDGTQIYDHEIETWDPSGTSFIWVRVPALTSQSKLRLWWGKSGQSAPTSTARSATWSSGFGGVWHLNQSLGFQTDSSPNALSGTSTAMADASTSVIPKAATLNGTTSTVTIPNATALNPTFISVEAWIKLSSTSAGTYSIFSKDKTTTTAGRVWQFRVNAGKIEFLPFRAANSNANVVSTATVNDDQFHHVCGTWDGSTVRVFVDGVQSGSVAFTGSLTANQTNAAYIGRMETNASNFFPGTIDEVRLSQSARSANWIKAGYDNQKPASVFLTASPAVTPDLDGDRLTDAWEVAELGAVSMSDGSQDADQDGSSDLLEYATGSDPVSGSGVPAVSMVQTVSSDPEFVFPQLAGGSGSIGVDYTAAGLRYGVEVSDGLGTWQSGISTVQWSTRREPLPGELERVGVRVIDPALLAKPKLFFRLRIQTVP